MLLGGSVLEEDSGKYYNTSTLWKNGSLLAKYKKINPIIAEIKAGVAKGNQPIVVETEIGKIGLLVCADTFDPDLVKQTPIWVPKLFLFQSQQWAHIQPLKVTR